MELDQLRYFLKVAEKGNFTRAAEDLFITQPALSRSIQKLEEELGQPLLDRKTRSVSLTDAGVLLEARAREVLAILENTKSLIEGKQKIVGGIIVIVSIVAAFVLMF